jgi:hypothetical protein
MKTFTIKGGLPGAKLALQLCVALQILGHSYFENINDV